LIKFNAGYYVGLWGCHRQLAISRMLINVDISAHSESMHVRQSVPTLQIFADPGPPHAFPHSMTAPVEPG
jgi:hypothetical protein